MALRVAVHSDNTSLKTTSYGDFLGSGVAYTNRDLVNTAGSGIPFKTAVTISSVSSSVVTAAHGTISLLPWEVLPFSFPVAGSGTSFNAQTKEFNTFLARPANKIQYYTGSNAPYSKTF